MPTGRSALAGQAALLATAEDIREDNAPNCYFLVQHDLTINATSDEAGQGLLHAPIPNDVNYLQALLDVQAVTANPAGGTPSSNVQRFIIGY